MIRKISLGKSLENEDWGSIKKDLNKLPIENVSGNSSEEDILQLLKIYGIQKNGDTVEIEIWGSGSPIQEFLWSVE